MKRPTLGTIVMGVVGFVILIWLLGIVVYPAENPSGIYTGKIISTTSDSILRRACFDCHSNETKFPWYYHLPFVRIKMGHSINEGREELNFSHWEQTSPSRRRKIFRESLEYMDKGEMPPTDYTFFHPDAKLSKEDITQIRQDILQAQSDGSIGVQSSGNNGDDDDEKEENDKD